MKITTARRITLTAVPIIVLISLIFHTGTGNISSLGWEAIAYICPLGILETWVASWTFIPRSIVALIIVIGLVILLGKVFCAWICPIPPIRKFLTFKRDTKAEQAIEDSKKAVEAAKALDAKATDLANEPVSVAAKTLDPAVELAIPESCDPATKDLKACPSSCTSCGAKRKKLDSRHVILGGALLSTAIFGFPVFCIICPVGLTFASLIALWRLVGFNEPSWALLIYPAFIAIELFVLKKWCFKFCPIGAVMSLMSIPNKFFRPRVDNKKCLRTQGIDCTVCVTVCEEELDPHYKDGMHECTKCGLCKDKCPTKAITIPFYAPNAKKKESLPESASK